MRALRLLEVAAQAEGLRWERRAERLALRCAWMAVAAAFAAGALVLLHIAAWAALEPEHGPLRTALALAAVDALVALCCLLVARRRRDRVDEEALRVRDTALAAFSRASLLGEAVSLFRWRRPALELGAMVLDRLVRR